MEDDIEDDDEDDEEEDDEDKMFEADDAEFNDIIDDQNMPIGEDLLVSEFKASDQEAQFQVESINNVMEKD